MQCTINWANEAEIGTEIVTDDNLNVGRLNLL